MALVDMALASTSVDLLVLVLGGAKTAENVWQVSV
jgi:hypothetical protein